jgi:hypothetical protein
MQLKTMTVILDVGQGFLITSCPLSTSASGSSELFSSLLVLCPPILLNFVQWF